MVVVVAAAAAVAAVTPLCSPALLIKGQETEALH
jgi:hypothetical protein